MALLRRPHGGTLCPGWPRPHARLPHEPPFGVLLATSTEFYQVQEGNFKTCPFPATQTQSLAPTSPKTPTV